MDSLPAEPQGKPTWEALGKSPTQIVAKCHLTLVIPTYIKPRYPQTIYTDQMNNKEEPWCIHVDAHRHTNTCGRYRFYGMLFFLRFFMWTIFKVFIEFVTILFLYYVFGSLTTRHVGS